MQIPSRSGAVLRSVAVAAGLAVAVSLGVVAPAAPAAALTGAPTVVSLTFDDSNADQLAAVDILNANGLDGTFYTLTGFIGQPGYQTLTDLTAMAAAGHEIASHTVTHPDMATLDAGEAQRQACQSRATLSAWGFQVTSFAYPFASLSDTAKAAVQACGYNSARNLGDIETRFGCTGCGFAEAMPPADPFELRVPDQVDSTWTLADLQNTVTNAENSTGGWIGLTFHHVCSDCDVEGLNITPALFTQFAQWLAARGATHNTSVKTVDQVIGGSVKPVVEVALPPAPGPGVNGVVNPSLEDLDPDGVPHCWMLAGYGSNSPTFTPVTPGRTGVVAEQLLMQDYVDGDAKAIMTMDFGSCASTVAVGQRYALSAWYTSTAVTQFAVYLRNGLGAWHYWTSSPWFPAAASYAQAVWESDPIPADATGLSFGLNLFSNGTLVTDDYALYALDGAPGVMVPGTPTVSGTPQVGSTLTASAGSWTPTTATLDYQWLSDGVAIVDATATTYTPTAADAAHTISVRVTGTATGFVSATATSAGVVIGAGTITPGTPTITGTAKVGSTLTVSPGTWSPPGVGLTQQWLRNGATIPGATATTYTPTAADATRTISVRVTATLTGYTTTTATTAGVVIGAGTITPGTPTITGTAKVGSTLTVSPGTWSPPGVGLTQQWLRNGAAIPGATATTYTPTAADATRTISVRVTATLTGYTTTTATTAGVVIGAGTITPGTPTITGTAKVGSKLTVNRGTWTPTGVGLTQQWLRNGAAIPGATATTYTPTAADATRTISVRVTATLTGYTTTTATTAGVVIGAGTITPGTPTITGTAKVGSKLTVNRGTWTPTGVGLTQQWLRNGAAIPGATATTYTPTAADATRTISVRVTATLTGYTTTTATTAGVVIGAGTITPGTPTITGTAKVGSKLTVNRGTWTPTGVGFTQQWLRNGAAIPGATATTYTLVSADRGHRISVRVVGTLAGFPSASATSAQTATVTARPVTVERLAGGDRYATAIAVSKMYAPGVARVYIASGSNFPDALSAASAAARYDSPMLITPSGSLPANIAAEIARLKPKLIVIVGSTGAVSSGVATQLAKIAPIRRLGGADRFETSRLVASDAFGSSGAKTAYLATGLDFPDALAAAPAAAKAGAPTILVNGAGTALDPATRALLAKLGTTTAKIAGGPATITPKLMASIDAVPGVAVRRLAGSDRYATAQAINADAFSTAATMYLATGAQFPDALVGAALAGMQESPLYLSVPSCLTPAAAAAVERLDSDRLVLFGGESALSARVKALSVCP